MGGLCQRWALSPGYAERLQQFVQRAAGLVTLAASRAGSFARLLRRRSTVVAMSSLAEQNWWARCRPAQADAR